ncbi:hypothetical protein MHIR_DE00267 [Candidatus Doolittlea endobia]|uniref:Uncharacterized protein n=1 Tax=Candidatus Doolittlea endobia TaxID=1778262 RepID=A0A143WSK6_9ENTR|nr:hypothetical protein MHIR_DE00267 [Candidatus Doolittlea endobia]
MPILLTCQAFCSLKAEILDIISVQCDQARFTWLFYPVYAAGRAFPSHGKLVAAG